MTWLAAGAALLGHAKAATVNFTGIDLADVSSADGQNFAFTAGGGPATGSVNVRLLSGDASAVTAGASPDTTGFNAEQYDPSQNGSGLTPAVYEFTFNVAETFTLTQNESLTTYERNGFTLVSGGAWTVLSSSNVDTVINGSDISFTGAGGANQQPPYGQYDIEGTGTTFDFTITNFVGLINYGSAISVDVVPEPGPAVWLLGGVAVLWGGRRLRRSARALASRD